MLFLSTAITVMLRCILSPPRAGYDIILTEPCPICDGSEHSFRCDYCYEKNTIYWDKRHFVQR